ncbi:UDP-forming cellulose synthase catalytic subunit [Escherichia coli]|uniref:UDP-forming cellulose synthase catalytic subunit n=1 Tax=Escherichia coli TaxID=562 RepID=UPI003891125F|nr:UDP-forming cellulose synthase catalytic subunit [Escherichia coli]HCC5745507.1 UDP-forming cellulose synthase catalytic subunit [Escherichia coli]
MNIKKNLLYHKLLVLPILTLFVIFISLIEQPLTFYQQTLFSSIMCLAVLLINFRKGKFITLFLMGVGILISSRYIFWRISTTLIWDKYPDIFFSLTLLIAEIYAWAVLLLGYFQVCFPLNRESLPLPADPTHWPSVDIFIPTYNEPLSVVQNTVYGALAMNWPEDKITIWLLDDGGREAFCRFAEETGIRYVARSTHEHAKAGNINHALTLAKSEFVAIFDCDHIPSVSFLQRTMGWFLADEKLAMMQTPHHFFSPDPFERNLGKFRQKPNEGHLFYGLIQNGTDTWNASFFCGSCAVIRRKPLDEIGGIAVETVTEDAHTSLRLHRLGYSSAYLRYPLAAGLATETLSAHIGQRIRWARGMIQILRIDNPLLGKGLQLSQRLCYLSSMMHFLSGVPRLIFLCAPLCPIFFSVGLIDATVTDIMSYVLPYLFIVVLINSRIQGKYRHSFWNEIYEMVLAWYITLPTLVALIAPAKGRFNVTAKGGLIANKYVDWQISYPYVIFAILNLCGLIAGIIQVSELNGEAALLKTICLMWLAYNTIIIGATLAVSIEQKQVRVSPRIEVVFSGHLLLTNGTRNPCSVIDFSEGGLGITLHGGVDNRNIEKNKPMTLYLHTGDEECAIPVEIVHVFKNKIGLKILPMTHKQHIDYVRATFSRDNLWSDWHNSLPRDKILKSFLTIFWVSLKGYYQFLLFLISPMKKK